MIHRRKFCKCLVTGVFTAALAPIAPGKDPPPFRLKYIVASSLYGRAGLADILPEVRKTAAQHIDVWPEHHANQREQLEAMGYERFAAMLRQNQVKLGIITRYDLGPFGLQNEMHVVRKLGGSMVISGSTGPKNLKGSALKTAVRRFAEKMKPHIDTAEETHVTIGIENHSNSLIESADSMHWFAEFASSCHIGVALAPYHLSQKPALIAKLIEDLGDRLVHFYAWQYGMGCHKKLPKEQELLQMPGRGKLNFVPLIAALKAINYNGWTEIFMHPVPRGIPILPKVENVTAEINRARRYLQECITKAS